MIRSIGRFILVSTFTHVIENGPARFNPINCAQFVSNYLGVFSLKLPLAFVTVRDA
jgi:hypothetical protein